MFLTKNNKEIIETSPCSTFSVSRKRNSGTCHPTAVPEEGTNGIWIEVDLLKIFEQLKTPRAWQEALKGIFQREKPTSITQSKWNSILTQIYLWLSKDTQQLKEIIKKGWTLQEIFGCHKISPQNRYDAMGLLLLLQGRTVVGIHKNSIDLQTPSGILQSYRKNALTCHKDEQSILHDIGLDQDLQLQAPAIVAKIATVQEMRREFYLALYKEFLSLYKNAWFLGEDPQWQAFNDVVLQFMEDTRHSQSSQEVNAFIKALDSTDRYGDRLVQT